MVQAKAGMVEALEELLQRSEAQEQASIGQYRVFAVTPPAETRFIPCYGQQDLLKSQYPTLYAFIGNTFGGTEAGLTFGLPDARGCVLAGADDMGGVAANRLTGRPGGVDGKAIGTIGGGELHVLTVAQLAAHKHSGVAGTAGLHSHPFTIRGQPFSDQGPRKPTLGGSNETLTWSSTTGDSGEHTHPVAIGDTGTNQGHNNVQPTLIGVICIYVGKAL